MTTLSTIKKSNPELFKDIKEELTKHKMEKQAKDNSLQKRVACKQRKDRLDFNSEIKRINEEFLTL